MAVDTMYTPDLIFGLLRGNIDPAFADLPLSERGVRFHQISAEPLAAALPEQSDTPKQTRIRIAELNAAPLALLSQSVDPGRVAIDRAIAAVGEPAFKAHDSGSIPELLDEVALNKRAGLLRQIVDAISATGCRVRAARRADPT